MPINSFLYPSKHVPAPYEVANSLRFDGASSAYLSKTFGSSGNTKTFTISFWVKKCELSSGPDTMSDAQMLLGGQQDSYPAFNLLFLHTNDAIFLKDAQASNDIQISIKSDAQFRDPSAWMHVVFAIDTTQSTASDRAKLYVNGVQQTDLSGENATGGARDTPLYPDQNQDLQFNSNTAHYINKYATNYEDMYIAEYVFIDGSALAPTSFGEFDSDSPNIWKPIDVSGLTFGTNGFYLDFENASSLGADVSGSSNNWTSNNIATTDQSTDTCTNNFATINPLTPATATLSEGNLKFANSATNHKGVVGTFGASSGKWYCEIKTTDVSDSTHVGIIDIDQQSDTPGNTTGYSSRGYSLSHERDVYNNNGIISGYTDWSGTYGDGDILGIAMDLDNNKLYFSKGGQWSNGSGAWDSTTFNASTGAIPITAGYTYTFGASVYNGNNEFNFGSPPFSISSGNADANGFGNFEYAVPSGFFSLCTKNLAEFG